jgi:LytS/YehU family sensor histidine kinase
MFISIGLVLPLFTGQLQSIGNKLLPMHIPVLLCGFICGPVYGVAVGFILPLFRSFILSMPVLYPNAVSMAFELGTYGLVSGLLFYSSDRKNLFDIYKSLIIAMISGRLVWGGVQLILLNIGDSPFTVSAFMAGAFLNAIPGIIIQIIFIPTLIVILKKMNFI